jgi:hypothetical protein
MSQNTQRSAVALRLTIVGNLTTPHSDSLVGLDTSKLPDGASAYVTAARVSYHLDKTLTPATAPGGIPLAVVPTTGPGIWVLDPGDAATEAWARFDGTADFSGLGPQTVVQNTWHAMPTPVEAEILYEGDSPGNVFTINVDTGIITYAGGSGRSFVITANFSMYCSTAAQIGEVEFTLNGDDIGSTVTRQTASQSLMGQTTAAPTHVSHTRIVTLTAEDTIQHMFRNISGTPGDVGFTRYVVSIASV